MKSFFTAIDDTLLHLSRQREWHIFFSLLAFLILPNLLFALPQSSVTRIPSIANYDFLFFGLVIVSLRLRWGVILYLLLALVTLFVTVSATFHFSTDELLFASGYAGTLHFDPALLPGGFIVAFVLSFGIGAWLVKHLTGSPQRSGTIALAAVTLCLTLLDTTNGSMCEMPNNFRDILRKHFDLSMCNRLQQSVNIAHSDTKALISGIINILPTSPEVTRWSPVDSAMQRALVTGKNAPFDGNIVLVLVESWGDTTRAPNVTQAILAPLLSTQITARYDIERGAVPFHGSTTHAELRELCGVNGNFRQISTRQHCLPERFQQRGYAVHAFHGFAAEMFARDRWWQRIGIPTQNMHFQSQLQPAFPERNCGIAFRGLCDRDVIASAGQLLRTSQKTFVYILTLNSHLPIHIEPQVQRRISCSRLHLDDNQCPLVASWREVMEAVAQQAGGPIQPTQFVIVGDHAPPLWSLSSSALFAQKTVPYIILTPRHGRENTP